MASPLAPAQDTALNCPTPLTTRRYDRYEVQAFTTESRVSGGNDAHTSPPFGSNASEAMVSEQENLSPSKSRHSRVLSGTELSPLKILSEQRKVSSGSSSDAMGPPPIRSPRKSSPEKRFPIKVNATSEQLQLTQTRAMDLDEAVKENRGLKRAIDIFEDEEGAVQENSRLGNTSGTVGVEVVVSDEDDEVAGPDDTMASTFSTFSAVPSMTMFTKLGQSPTKFSTLGGYMPKARPDQPSSGGRGSTDSEDTGNATSLLMDFTEQLRQQRRSPTARASLSPSRTTPKMGTSPSRLFTNLIDFDIPPMPTPRSIPTITPRELESLKSNFLSEISSLKASLSGKEAEVQSLKSAVGDAEKRVGESMEKLREECSSKEQLAAEKESWEARGREMEGVLQKVKEEIMLSEKERDEFERKLDESEKRREAAEMLHQEAESKMAGMRAGKETDTSSSPEKNKNPGSSHNRDVEIAVERVARELHALYKSKHETKVTALKKSYEMRWEKKTRELENRVKELGGENERLRAGRDNDVAKPDYNSAESQERKAQAVKDSAAIKELNADIQRLEAVVTTVKRDNEDLRGMLEQERVEKGELVQLAEEMMSMQSFVAPQQQQQHAQPQQSRQVERPDPTKTPRASTDRSAAGRGSGLKMPGSGLRAPTDRMRGVGGLPRPGGVGRSGIMSSIERMGSHRGRAAE